MDYFNAFTSDDNTTIIDIINKYKVLLRNYQIEMKQGTKSLDSLNQLNLGFCITLYKQNLNPLVNKKNKYLIDSKIAELSLELPKFIKQFELINENNPKVLCNKVYNLLIEHKNKINRVIKTVKAARNEKELELVITKNKQINWVLTFNNNLTSYLETMLMPGLFYTKEMTSFLAELKNKTNSLELITYLSKNINFLRKVDCANMTLINNILYDDDRSSLIYEDAIALGNYMTSTINNDVITNQLTIDELISKYTSSKIASEEKRLIKELGFHNTCDQN